MKNVSLPYPHLITAFYDQFDIPLDDEHFMKNKRTFKIGVEVINSFGFVKNIDSQPILD